MILQKWNSNVCYFIRNLKLSLTTKLLGLRYSGNINRRRRDFLGNKFTIDQFIHWDLFCQQPEIKSNILDRLKIFVGRSKINVAYAMGISGQHIVENFFILPEIWGDKLCSFRT